jgi:hypothetical protein
MKVEVLGRQGESVCRIEVPAELPEVIGIHARHFVLDYTKLWEGAKYIECNFLRIERRAEGARGGPEDRKAAGA